MEYKTGKKEVVIIRKDIPPNSTDVIAERIKADCTVEEVSIRFYVGQQLSLEVYPFIEHKGNKIESFFTFPNTTKGTISGDDEYLKFPVNVSCEYDDFIKVQVWNKDLINTYTLAIDIVVDYMGGLERAVV